jgi:hypothetical protein
MVSRASGLIFGFLLFGQPVITYLLEIANQIDPKWKERLILEQSVHSLLARGSRSADHISNILSNVPTNAQLMLRLLRDAEHRQRPLPQTMLQAQKDIEAEQQQAAEDERSDEISSEEDYEHPEDHQEEDEEMERIQEEIVQGHKDEPMNRRMMGKMKRTMRKMGARDRARKAIDRAGEFKEEVRADGVLLDLRKGAVCLSFDRSFSSPASFRDNADDFRRSPS